MKIFKTFGICAYLLLTFFLSCTEKEPVPIPESPSDLLATVVSTSQIDLSWTDNSAVESNFNLERKTDATDFQIIATLQKDITVYSDKNLTENSTYTYRVNAINSEDKPSPFSNEVSATTLGVPVLSTISVTEITAFSATGGGDITLDGGSEITARGIVWSSDPSPTIDLSSKTVDGIGTGNYSSVLTNLNWQTRYYVRAYATNSTGTGYGDEVNFMTGQVTITTTSLTSVDYFSAISGGTIGEDGGYPITERGVVWSTDHDPTIDLETKTIDGGGTGTFVGSMNGLLSNETYFVRAYVTSEVGTAYGKELEFITKGLEDSDGNFYSVVQIGTQMWMSENLATTSYSDGESIQLVTDNTEWAALTTGAYSWYNNDQAANEEIYGALYNWYSVESGNLCPIGWHVPTDAEWNTLANFLGGNEVAGGKMKAVGTEYWAAPNTAATNESGFNGLPGGIRIAAGEFRSPGFNGDWWTSTEKDASTAYPRDLQANTGVLNIELNGTPKDFGFSIRCIKD